MKETGSLPRIDARAPVSLMLSWTVVLSFMLVGARVLALSTGQSRAFGLVWGAMVGLIAFISPVSGVALSVGNVFVSLDDSLPIGLSVGQIAGAGATARMVLEFTTHRVKLRRVWRPSHLALAGIAFVILLSAIFSPFFALPLAPLRKLFLIVLLYLLTLAYVDTPGKLLFLQFTVVLCAGLAAAWAINESMSTPMSHLLAREYGARGLVGNPNYQGIYFATAMPLCVSVVMYLKSARWRALAIAAGVSIVGGVVATASRGGLLVLGISLLLVVMIWGPRQRRVQWFLGVLLVVLVVVLTRNDFARLRFGNALNSLSEGTAQNESRVRLTDDSLAVWSHYPLLGVGAGNWLLGVNQLEMRATSVSSPHVWPAQILAEMGVLGMGCYLAFVLLCVQDYRDTIRYLDKQSSSCADLIRGFFAAALAMSLAWTSGNPFNQLWFELLLIGGIGMRILSCQDEVSSTTRVSRFSEGKTVRGLH